MAAKSNGKSEKKTTFPVPESKELNRNLMRGVFELARLHTPELTLLSWYSSGSNPVPSSHTKILTYIVWTLCLAIHILRHQIEASEFFPMVFKNYLIVALTHSTCCTMKYAPLFQLQLFTANEKLPAIY